jgi:hypothetical protein
MRSSTRRRDEQSGVSLVLVLVALTIFGLLVPVLGQFGSVNGVSAYLLHGQRVDRYAADSGMQGAIAWAQRVRTGGRAFVPCPEIQTGPLPDASAAFNRSVTVRCQGFRGSGEPQETPSMPQYAVLALANTVNEDGIEVLGSGSLRTHGAWWSDTGTPGGAEAIRVDGVRVDASDDLVGGRGSCRLLNGGRLDASPLRCDTGVSKGDPGWPSAVQSIADVPIRWAPTCSDVSQYGVVTLQPGYYWDRAGLESLTRTNACGRPIVLWLQPGGSYYFDFDFYDGSNGDQARWVIGGGTAANVVVGGTPNGWSPGDPNAVPEATAAVRAATNDAPGSCLPGTGPHLVFGGASQMVVDAPGLLELCDPGGSGQRISLYGQQQDEAHSAQVFSSTPVDGTVSGGLTWPSTFDPAALAQAECHGTDPCDPGSYVAGTLSGTKQQATLDLRLPRTIPPGGRVDAVDLVIDHRETTANPDDLRTLHVELTDGATTFDCNNDLSGDLQAGDQWHRDTLTCGNGPRHPLPKNLGDFHVVVTIATRNGNKSEDTPQVTFSLDHLSLDAHVTMPTLRKQSGCVATVDCRWFFVDDQGASGASAARAWVHGTVYTTIGRVRLRLAGNGGVGLTRGVVARNIQIDDPAGTDSYFPVSLPGGGSYRDRLVTFEATLDGDSSPALRARVRFCDAQPEGGSHDDGDTLKADGCAGAAASVPRILAWEPAR